MTSPEWLAAGSDAEAEEHVSEDTQNKEQVDVVDLDEKLDHVVVDILDHGIHLADISGSRGTREEVRDDRLHAA